MSNNVVEYLAQLKAKDPNRANWIMDCPDVGTNDFGFLKVRLCKPIIAATNVRYDFKSAYSTNPTIAPVLSGAKVHVTAFWVPIRLYVPALRDGAQVKAGKSDFSFPTINFNYPNVRRQYLTLSDSDGLSGALTQFAGAGLPYIPANSIYTSLKMWAPYFQPVGFASQDGYQGGYPEPKNAIPLLAYYDIYRNYFMNSQADQRVPFRTQGFSRVFIDGPGSSGDGFVTQYPVDIYRSREDFDDFFRKVRNIGNSIPYPMGDGSFDISLQLSTFLGVENIGPKKKVEYHGTDAPTIASTEFSAYNDNHFGELRDTYRSDYYTAFLSNENVEYERSTARVQTDTDGIITMEQIYSAEKIQNFVRRTIFKNSDYAEFIDAQYGVKPSTDITKPMFLGSVTIDLAFNDIIAQAQTSSGSSEISSNTDLGSRASLGFGRMITGKLRDKDDRNFVNFTAREPGYLMVLESIVPNVSYWQGFHPMYDKRSLESLYFPSFDKDGYQDKQLKYLVEQSSTSFNMLPTAIPFGNYNYAYAQEPAWWEYMTTHGTVSDQMVENGVYRHWVFRRDYTPNWTLTWNHTTNAPFGPLQGTVLNYPTDIYVNPEPFNEIFANVNGLDNFQTYYRHSLKLYQPLSHRFLSF